jgi:hypothetical protein
MKANPRIFIEIAETTFQIENFVSGFQVLFKLIHALLIQYPAECVHIWKFIEKLLYNIDTTSVNNNQVTTLLNEFKLALSKE